MENTVDVESYLNPWNAPMATVHFLGGIIISCYSFKIDNENGMFFYGNTKNTNAEHVTDLMIHLIINKLSRSVLLEMFPLFNIDIWTVTKVG